MNAVPSSRPPGRGKAWWIRPAAVLVPVLLVLVAVTVQTLRAASPPGPGDVAPIFEAPLLQSDGELALQDVRGMPVVLNFWASWCDPCEDEAPMLADALAEYRGRVAFVGVDIKDARSDAVDFVERWGLDYPHVRDESLEIYQSYRLSGQPETFFIDHDGIIVDHVKGPLTRDVLFSLLDLLVRRNA